MHMEVGGSLVFSERQRCGTRNVGASSVSGQGAPERLRLLERIDAYTDATQQGDER